MTTQALRLADSYLKLSPVDRISFWQKVEESEKTSLGWTDAELLELARESEARGGKKSSAEVRKGLEIS